MRSARRLPGAGRRSQNVAASEPPASAGGTPQGWDAAGSKATAPEVQEVTVRPAFYASSNHGGLRDWWTVLHPPYTAWHLAYVVIGASLAPRLHLGRLLATLLAFFLAVGVAAHALDELHGRPLRTEIPSGVLVTVSAGALVVAVALGGVGASQIGWPIVPFIVVGPLLVVAYNAEWFGGLIHNDSAFALSWGVFPLLTAYVAQAERLSVVALVAGTGAFALSRAQRVLSTQARWARRRVADVEGTVYLSDGGTRPLDRNLLLEPVERALRLLSWSTVLLAASLALARLG